MSVLAAHHKVLQSLYPDTELTPFKMCATCLRSVHAGRIPELATYYGYTCPPMLENLPQLDLIVARCTKPFAQW